MESPPRSETGRICVAPVSASDRLLDQETGNQRGYESYSFTVRIDRGEWIAVPSDAPRWIDEVELGSMHLMTIRDGERQIESFRFAFASRGGPTLCLSCKAWYQTWLLEPPLNRPWCRCPE